MPLALMAVLAACVLATSFLSGVFGIAGGMILIGVLFLMMPVPEAMALHAVTQLSANGWRALLWWRYIRLRSAMGYLAGSFVALVLWSVISYVPDKAVAMLLLGAMPFAVRALPPRFKPDAARIDHGLLYGALCMSAMLLTGVVGPLIDTFFLGGKLDRREIVATKAFCQVAGHSAKLVYFTTFAAQATVDSTLMIVAITCSIVGTTVARRFLEAMSDKQFRTWTWRIVTAVSGFYVLQGIYLLAVPVLEAAP